MYTKEQVKEMLDANTLLVRSIYSEMGTPDDLTADEWADEVLKILNDPSYKQEIIEQLNEE